MIRSLLLVAAGLTLSGCLSVDVEPTRVSLGAEVCEAGLAPTRVAEIYFGRNIGDVVGVSEDDWADFVDREITPRFPDGLTVIDARGQWRGQSGAVGREPSKVVVIVLSGAPGEQAQLDAIRQAYVTRFQQEAVMMTTHTACVGF